VRSVIEAASDRAEDVCILDTEASPEHLSRGTARHADAMYAVVEPYFKSLETGRRITVLGRDLGLDRVGLIANKIRDDHELSAVREFADQHGLELAGVVPFDPALPEAERAQRAPLDFAPDSPAVKAIAELAQEVSKAPLAAPPSGVQASPAHRLK
jgi:CO dehydrogenase maturation factor